MEYEFLVIKKLEKKTLGKYLPKEILAEVTHLSPLAICALTKEEKQTSPEPIGYAFFLEGRPARLLWIEVREAYRGSNLGYQLLEHAIDYLQKEGISGIFTTLSGDYFSTFSGNTFLLKNDFDVVNQNKRYITYQKRHISTNPKIKAFRKTGDLLLPYVVPLSKGTHKHKEFLLEHTDDFRIEKASYIDANHSFFYIKNNQVEGFVVSIRKTPTEIYVVDFYVTNGPTVAEATKGLLAALFKQCIGKDLCFITKNEDQRDLFKQLIGTPDRDVPYWEYYRGFDGRKGDIDG